MIKIFNENDRDFSTNGNVAINPIKCREIKRKSLNGWYIEVELNVKYREYIKQDKLCVIKTKSKLRPQAFRIENPKIANNTISFIANHVMFDSKKYFLVDVRPTNQNGPNALSYINDRTDKKSPFKIFSDVSTESTAYFIRKNLFEAWEVIEERWNGAFDADNWDISFLKKVGNDNGENVSYGKNMQGIEIYEDWSNVCTKIYPVGPDELMLDEQFLESDIQYPTPYTNTITFNSELELDEKMTDEEKRKELIKELRKNAKEYLEENKYPKVSYEATSNINQNMEIGDIIHVKHPLVNLLTEVIEYEHNVLTGKVEVLVFGNYKRDVKSKFDNIKDSINKVTDQIIEGLAKQNIVIKEQTDLINSLNKLGRVYIDENEILILDALPKEKAKNVWRLGLGGFGFSSNGFEGPFEIAMTMDGQINAKFITTGELNANIIKTGSLRSRNYKQGVSGTGINLDTGVIETANFKINDKGEIEKATSGNIGGFNLGEKTFTADLTLDKTYTQADLDRLENILLEKTSPTKNDYDKYDLDHNGIFNTVDLLHVVKLFRKYANGKGKLVFNTYASDDAIILTDDIGEVCANIGLFGSFFNVLSAGGIYCDSTILFLNRNKNILTIGLTESGDGNINISNSLGTSTITLNGKDGSIGAKAFNNTSSLEEKKNVERLKIDAIELIKKSDICEFNYKDEKNEDKKHIGMVIGGEYNCPEIIISKNGKSIDQYSYISLLYLCMQQLIDKVEKLEKEAEKKNEHKQ